MEALTIIKAGLCDRCLQYAEDCECCGDCGCVDLHERDCSEAATMTMRYSMARFQSAIVPCMQRSTLMGLGDDERTEETPVFVFRVSESVSALETTCEFVVLRPTLRSCR